MRALPLVVAASLVVATTGNVAPSSGGPASGASTAGGGSGAPAREKPRGQRDDAERTLSAKDVQTYFAPYAPEVRGCYLAHARDRSATGVLRLELIVHANGNIFRFGFAAPGLGRASRARLDACLRKLVPTWHLPVRKGFTTAIVPFLFHRATTPGAGPFESCWDPRGCPVGAVKGGSR